MFIRILVALLIVTGCAKENEPADKPVKVVLKEGGDCLSSFGDNITKFQKGELSNGQVAQFWSCVQGAVSDYQRLTSGDQVGGAYTPAAVRGFLKKYFIKSETIPDSMLASLMGIKRVVLSGSERVISRDELLRLHRFLEMIKEISVEMNPYARVIFMKQDTATDEEIRVAGAVVETAINRLGEWLNQQNQPYSFDEMRALVASLEEFRQGDKQKSDLFGRLKQGIEVIPPAKRILLNGDEDRIEGRSWKPMAASFGQAYRGLLAMQYAFEADLNTALTREAVPSALQNAAQIIEHGVRAHKENEIPIALWRELFMRIEATGWLPKDINAEALEYAFVWFKNRVLAKGRQPAPEGFTLAHVNEFKRVIADWTMLRKAVNGHGPFVGEVGQLFRQTLNSGGAHEWDQQGRIVFALNPAKNWSTAGAMRMIWPFLAIKVVKGAYVSQPEMNDSQMEAAGLEVLDVFRKFGWLLETKNTIGKKLLREADLFTLASNGNGRIDLHEGTRYLAFIASSYSAAKIWTQKAEAKCGGLPAECVRRTGGEPGQGILDSMPRLKGWLEQKDALNRFVLYARAGEETVLDKVSQGELGTGDLLQVWMLFQYVEAFLMRYDTDHSDTINLAESDPAFRVFGPVLGTMLSGVGVPPDEVFGFFTFMMKYGDTPFTLYGGQVLYNHWKWHPTEWQFESERTHLMGILNQLSKL